MIGMPYWLWLVIGFVLCALEMFIGVFVVLAFGIAALITGLVVWIFGFDTLAIQLIVYLVSTCITSLVIYGLYSNRRAPSIGQSDQFVGEVGMVVQAQDASLSPSQTGRVRFQKPILGSDLWDCRPATDCVLHEGGRVKVVAFEGSVVVVKTL